MKAFKSAMITLANLGYSQGYIIAKARDQIISALKSLPGTKKPR